MKTILLLKVINFTKKGDQSILDQPPQSKNIVQAVEHHPYVFMIVL